MLRNFFGDDANSIDSGCFMQSSRLLICFSLTILFLAASCSKKDSSANSIKAAEATWQNPADEDCKKFAKELQDVVNKGDTAAFNQLVDWQSILDRATADIQAPQSRTGFSKGFLGSVNSSQGLASQFSEQCKNGGSFKLVRIHEQDGRKRALLRILFGNGAVNYYDFVLVRKPDGKVQAVDIFVHMSGEMMSETMRRLFLFVASEETKSVLDRLTGSENQYLKHSREIQQMTQANASGDFKTAMAVYHQLPAEVQKEKFLMLIAMAAAQNVSDEEYQGVLSAFKTAYPQDVCRDFVLIDYYLLRKDYENALASSGRLDQAIGGDAHLKYMSGQIYTLQNKSAQARDMFEKAIEMEADYQPAYENLLQLAYEEKKFDECVRLLDRMNEKCNLPFTDLEETSENAEFLKSKEYQDWKEKKAN